MRRAYLVTLIFTAALLLGACRPATSAENPQVASVAASAPTSRPAVQTTETQDEHTSNTLDRKGNVIMQKATFGAGCFWGVEAGFNRIEGVAETAVGYSGGTVINPSYRQVCAADTGHAEVVEVTFDPAVVSYTTLLDAFWSLHDPTQLNRQGPDVGDQYRSVIFTHDKEQTEQARASLEQTQNTDAFKRRNASGHFVAVGVQNGGNVSDHFLCRSDRPDRRRNPAAPFDARSQRQPDHAA